MDVFAGGSDSTNAVPQRRSPWRRGPVAAAAGTVLAAGLAAAALSGGAPPGLGRLEPVAGESRSSATLFGASFERREGESYAAALDRTDAALGLQIVRVFYPGAPDPWPGLAPGRPVVVSFKLHPGEVLAGRHDAAMTAWFRSAPRDEEVYWVLWHEPEDDIESGAFTAEQFAAAVLRLDALADAADNPRLHTTVVLMAYTTLEVSGRNWRDYVPEASSVDVLAWDAYNLDTDDGVYPSVDDLLDGPRRASQSIGSRFALAELGSVRVAGDTGDRRAAWLRSVGRYATEHDAAFVTYFDFLWNDGEDDYRLDDKSSVQVWRELSAGE